MNLGVVQNDYRARKQPRENVLTQERFHIVALHGSLFVPNTEHALHVQGTKDRQVPAAAKRNGFHEALASFTPAVVLIKRKRKAGLVQKNQIVGINLL
jgi:hypothetical protein